MPPMPYANVKLNLDLKPTGRRHVYFDTGAPVDTPILDRAGLLPGHVIKGPAVVEQLDATTLMFPSDTASVDADSPAHGHLNFGFRASRSQSPNKLTPTTRSISAIAGKITNHHSPENR